MFELEGGCHDKGSVLLLELAKLETCPVADLLRRLNIPEQVHIVL